MSQRGRRDRQAALLLKAPSAIRFIAVALVVPLILFAGVLWMRGEYHRAEAIRRQLANSYDRRIADLTLLARLKAAQSEQRGLLATGNHVHLRHYQTAKADAAQRLSDVRRARGEDSADDVELLRSLIETTFTELDRGIAAAPPRPGSPRDSATLNRDDALMDRVAALIGANIAAEEARSEERSAAFTRQRRTLQNTIKLFVVVVTVTLAAALLGLWQSRRERYAAMIETFDAAERNATILDSTIDAILILNPSGTIETANAAAARMLGYDVDELQRRDIGTILDIAPGEGKFHDRIGLVDGQLRRSFFPDRMIRYRDGREVPVDVAIGLMSLPDGDHLVASIRDISERKRIDRVKDDLVSTVSHELRTPLTSIVGSLALLRARGVEAMPESAARLIEIAENNSRRLIRLINDMLDIDRIESGKLEIAREPIDLRDVVKDACTGSEGLAREADVTLDCHHPDAPLIVRGDGGRLLQVMTNLVSNAVHASPRGSTVGIGILVDGDRAIITVDDRGPGIPAHFRDRIFGRFERDASNRGAVGTGLGLAISREIVHRHDGSIWFEDRPGGGTRFAVALGLAAGSGTARAATHRILVCIDEDAAAGPLVAAIVNEGCESVIVRSIADAEARIARETYAAVMICLDLPDGDGLAFLHRLRDREPALPVIAVATRAQGDGDTPAMLDVIDWIEKPGSPERLSTALRSAISRSKARVPVILHLDDDPDLIDVVAAALAPESRIVPATSLAEARRILQHLSPDAAILDLRLAQGSGLDLIPFLFDAKGLAIPTIIYSAQDPEGDAGKSADAVLVKARGSIPDLKATLRRIIDTRAPGLRAA